MKHFRVYWLTCVVALAAVAASATTIVLPTDAQLVAKTPLIVQGTVVSSQAVERDGRIWTETRLEVEKALKGTASGTLVIRELGGEIEGRITKIYGAPVYEPGQRVMAFLIASPRGDYQTMDLFVGKFAEEQTLSGQRLWTREVVVDEVNLLDANFEPIVARNVQRDAAGFESFIRDTARGLKPAVTNYGLENPIIDGSFDKPAGGKIKPNFTTISEPSIYRWFAMDNGGSVRWYSHGTQSGYSGGGVNEVTTAMNVWNSYGSARINFVYSGAGSGQPGSVSGGPNGVNEILFNDVRNDIAGTFTGSGVVGLGGFNGVSGSQTWTPTFSADGTHTQHAYSAGNIAEGNLAIQDGVSPAAGISSTTLAEILAHEFGHTLGFGHSADPIALMYSSVTHLGPSLRADDQLGARWLYPNGTQSGGGGNGGGGGTPTPITTPAAPTNLRASLLTTTSVSLQWTDNATNESGFYVYVAYNGSGYTRINGTISANATGANVTGVSPGPYSFYVAAYNAAGEAQSPAVAITVPTPTPSPSPVNAAFTFSPGNGTAGVTNFQFTDASTGPVVSRLWQFGDGTTSQQQNPAHVFASAGSYTVTLSVTGSGGQQSSISRSVTVTAPVPVIPPVAAAFAYAPQSPKVGQAVNFNDQSTGSPTQWFWWFGDGSTSSSRNPSKTYAVAGSYSVTLQVWNATTTATTSQTITVQAFPPFRSLVSAAAQTGGVGNSVWRTELTLFNAGSAPASGQLLFIPGAGGTVVTRDLYLAPSEARTFTNALPDIFGIASGSGAIAVEATSALGTPDIKISSRTFTTGATGTYGQAVPQVPADELQQTLWVTGIESNADYRTNLGLVNRSGAALSVGLALFASNGAPLATNTITLPANNFQQSSLAGYFPSYDGQARDGMTVRAVAGAAGAVSVYASVVDNRTQDPVYIQGMPQPAASRVLIPAVGRAPGIGGTYWRSDVTVLNPNSYGVNLRWRYLPAGSNNTTISWSSLTLAAGETRVLRDVASMFGVTSGTGALELSADSGAPPVVTSRTYTSTVEGGTFGQSIDPVVAYRADAYVPGLRADAVYRSNVGFFNNSDSQTGVTVRLLANGQQIASTFVAVPAHAPVQYSLTGLFPDVNLSLYPALTLHAHTDGGAILFAYGSVVDNVSGDPVFFAAQ